MPACNVAFWRQAACTLADTVWDFENSAPVKTFARPSPNTKLPGRYVLYRDEAYGTERDKK